MPEEINYIWLFYGMLPIVAFFYAAVGHGGASGYLALMALFSFSPLVMKPTALMLNLFVVAIAFYHFWREGYFKHQLFFSFAISSIPLSFLGGTMDIEESMYKKILAVLLVFAILRMLFIVEKRQGQPIKIKFWQGGIIGGCIGFFSGLIGIGGGVILTPVILLMHWGSLKEAAAVSALFIWVNSAAALLGQFKTGIHLDSHSFIFIALAGIGGFIGAYFGSKKMNSKVLTFILAIILGVACIKLFFS